MHHHDGTLLCSLCQRSLSARYIGNLTVLMRGVQKENLIFRPVTKLFVHTKRVFTFSLINYSHLPAVSIWWSMCGLGAVYWALSGAKQEPSGVLDSPPNPETRIGAPPNPASGI